MVRLALGDDLFHQFLKEIMGQVVGKVKVRQPIPDDTQPFRPIGGRLLVKRIEDPLSLLRLDRLFFQLGIKAALGDDPPGE